MEKSTKTYSLEENLGEIKTNKSSDWNGYLLFVGLVTSLSSLAYGYNISAIDSPRKVFAFCNTESNESFLTSCIFVSDSYWAFVVAAFCVGGLFGALCSGSLTNTFGRKKVLIYHTFPYMIGTLIFSFAPNIYCLIIGRFLVGIASGICTVAVPMYLAEISPDSIRGQICIMHQGAIVLGIFIAQILAFPFSNEIFWRLYFIIPGFFSALQALIVFSFPESPKYLADKGNLIEATKALKRLRNDEHLTEEVLKLEHSYKKRLASGETKSLSLMELFRTRLAHKSTIIGVTYHLIQQFSGINAIFFFSATLFSGLGIDEKMIGLIIGVFYIFMTGISIVLMDRAGRRPLTLVSCSIMAVGAIGLTTSLKFDFAAPFLSIVFILLFVGGFSLGVGPVAWVILGDIFPTSAVNAGVTLAISVNWIGQILLAFTLLPLLKSLGVYIYLIFATFLLIFLVFAYFYIPETKGKPADYL